MINSINPLVTVIIPAYNHEKYVEECIVSVLNQTYVNLQIIIINDGSLDNTVSVIEKIISDKQSNRVIEFYNQENQGVCRTLNRGIELSKGKYIAIIASDDVWELDKLEKQVEFLERNENIGMVFTDTYFIKDLDKSSVRYTDYKPEIRKYFLNGVQNSNVHKKLIYNCFIPAISVMIKKECLEVVGYFDETLKSEDYDMWLRFTMLYPIGFIDEPLAYQRKHDSNVSNSALRAIPEIAQIVYKNFQQGSLKSRPLKALYVYFTFFFRAAFNRLRRVFLIK